MNLLRVMKAYGLIMMLTCYIIMLMIIICAGVTGWRVLLDFNIYNEAIFEVVLFAFSVPCVMFYFMELEKHE